MLGARGTDVEVASPTRHPLASFSRWCRAVRPVPAPGDDPVGYLRALDALLAAGRCTALLATHEQAWLLAAGERYLPHARGRLAVAGAGAFERVQSKISFAALCDELGIPQPAWHEVGCEADLDRVGYPVWVKAAYSTAGRGVRRAATRAEAVSAWRALGGTGTAGDPVKVMVQAPAAGAYRQVAALFDRGRLIAAACSQRIGPGAGGSAAARLSVADPGAVDAVVRLGRELEWHGGLTCDYFADGAGRRLFIECNPRTTEPGNAAAAGVDLPSLTIALATGGPLPRAPLIARAGVRTRSTMALALGAAETRGTRRAVVGALGRALGGRGPLRGSREVLTPVLRDPPGLVPALAAVGAVLVRPGAVADLAGDAVGAYAITPATIARLNGEPA
ncbi:MAG: carbamoyl-phosphate-synthetase [Actinomyces dentalis]